MRGKSKMLVIDVWVLWKGILSMKEEFGKHDRYWEGTGEEISFWLDKWVGENQLASQILLLFRCARIARQEYVEKISGHLAWKPTFKRNLSE